jgi:hypothetical protein
MNQLDKYLSLLFCALASVSFPEKTTGIAVDPDHLKRIDTLVMKLNLLSTVVIPGLPIWGTGSSTSSEQPARTVSRGEVILPPDAILLNRYWGY